MVQGWAQHFSQQWPGSVFEEPFALNRTQLIANQHLPISCGQDLLSNYVQVRIFSKGRLHLFRSISHHPRAQQIQLANPKTSFQLIPSTPCNLKPWHYPSGPGIHNLHGPHQHMCSGPAEVRNSLRHSWQELISPYLFGIQKSSPNLTKAADVSRCCPPVSGS